jgi:probable F420-dependent oxidoreductase
MQIGTGPPHAARVSRDALKRFAVTSEELGFDTIRVSEHLLVPMHIESPYPYSADGKVYWDHTAPWLHAMVALAFIAGVTERIRIGTSIIPMMTRNPLALAKEAATVDLLSDGRLDLALGAGWCHEEAAMLGVASDHPIGRLEESVDILRLAWGEDSFEYHGTYFDFDEVAVHPQPVQGAALPIHIGGQSPRLIKLAAEKAEGSIISARIERLPEVRAGLPADKIVSVPLPLLPDFDPDEALSRATAFSEQGVGHISITSRDEGLDGVLAVLTRFSEEVMPALSAATAAA